VLVIVLRMIIAMVAAGLAGKLVPITLLRFGQVPASASSMILTTVNGVTGLFFFLGIAMLLASMLRWLSDQGDASTLTP
jgi:magnesium transporter